MAAMRASSASTSRVFLARPPLISSLRPRSRWLPRSRRRATPCKWAALTRWAFRPERPPSRDCGLRSTRASAARKPSTESPRNSSCSLSSSGEPWPLRASLANEVWVTARRNNSWLEKWYPILASRDASSARMSRRRLLCHGLGGGGAGPDAPRRRLDPRVEVGLGQNLVAHGDGFVGLAAICQGVRQVHSEGRLGNQGDSRLERGRGGIPVLARHGNQTEIVLGLPGYLLLVVRPLLVAELRRLGRGVDDFNGLVGVILGLGQALFLIEIVLAGVLGRNVGQHEGGLIGLGIGGEGLAGIDLGLDPVALLLIGVGFGDQDGVLELGIGELDEQVVVGFDDGVLVAGLDRSLPGLQRRQLGLGLGRGGFGGRGGLRRPGGGGLGEQANGAGGQQGGGKNRSFHGVKTPSKVSEYVAMRRPRFLGPFWRLRVRRAPLESVESPGPGRPRRRRAFPGSTASKPCPAARGPDRGSSGTTVRRFRGRSAAWRCAPAHTRTWRAAIFDRSPASRPGTTPWPCPAWPDPPASPPAGSRRRRAV